MARHRVIIFDFDGVLAESVQVKTDAFATLYKSFGPDIVKKVIEFHFENGGMSRFRKFRHFHEKFLGRSLSQSNEDSLGRQFSRLVVDGVIAAPMVPGAIEFLQAYKDSVEMHIASGTPQDEMVHIVEQKGLESFFKSVHGSPRSKTQIISDILKTYAYNPDSVVMVGDAMSDFRGALNTGVHFVGRVKKNEQNIFPEHVTAIENLKTLQACINL